MPPRTAPQAPAPFNTANALFLLRTVEQTEKDRSERFNEEESPTPLDSEVEKDDGSLKGFFKSLW